MKFRNAGNCSRINRVMGCRRHPELLHLYISRDLPRTGVPGLRFPLFVLGCTITALLLLSPPAVAADDTARIGAPIVSRYLQAIENQKEHPQSVLMEVSIDADIPRLKKTGKLHAFRFISRLGKIVYSLVRFEGDNLVKKEVIGQYLRAESEAKEQHSAALALTPENYKFRYQETAKYNDRTAFVFQVTPKKNRVGTYKGELWLDSETYLPLREWGVLAKNPSVFLKNVYFVRDYAIYKGIQVPRRLISNVDTRLVGAANLTIWFDNFRVGAAEPAGQTQITSTHDGDTGAAGDGISAH